MSYVCGRVCANVRRRVCCFSVSVYLVPPTDSSINTHDNDDSGGGHDDDDHVGGDGDDVENDYSS